MYNIEKDENQLIKVTIKIDGEEFLKAKHEIMEKYKDAKVDGFRKGHVPYDIIEKEFAGNIRQELYETLVNQEFHKFLVESNENPITKLDVLSENITSEGLEVELCFGAMPKFELEDKYKNLDIEYKVQEEVKQEDVESRLDDIAKREKEKVVIDKEVIENNDIANINFLGFVDGVEFEGGKAENFDLLLGSHQFIDNFEDQIVGHKVGDEFEVNVTFPAEYHAENLKGKPATFKVKLNSIKAEKEVEKNDEFAKKNGFENLEMFKSAIKENIEKERAHQVELENYQKIVEKLVSVVDMKIPSMAIKEESDRQIQELKDQLKQYGQDLDTFLKQQNTSKEEFEKESFERAEKIVKYNLIASKVIESENITVSADEIEVELTNIAMQYSIGLVQLKEELKKMGLAEKYNKDIENKLLNDKLRKVLLEYNAK